MEQAPARLQRVRRAGVGGHSDVDHSRAVCVLSDAAISGCGIIRATRRVEEASLFRKGENERFFPLLVYIP